MPGAHSRNNGRKGGRPVGSKSKATLEKEAALAILREMVGAEVRPMTAVQIKAAKGMYYLVARERKTGRIRHLTKELTTAILSGKNQGYDIIEAWQKFPSTPAYQDLMNRAYGKPPEQVVVDGELDHEIVIRWKTDEDEEDEDE